MAEQTTEILLVEDNPSDEALALHVFRKHHLTSRVHVIRDGAEALGYFFGARGAAEHTLGSPPRVVLLDLKLPLVSGLEVLRQIKADPRTRRIPVVILTSSREERDIVESYALGANSYIVKPIVFEQFSEALRALGAYWLLLNQLPGSPGVTGT
jgi:two-component system response regulator